MRACVFGISLGCDAFGLDYCHSRTIIVYFLFVCVCVYQGGREGGREGGVARIFNMVLVSVILMTAVKKFKLS